MILEELADLIAETIIVNDASTDRTSEIARALMEKFKGIKLNPTPLLEAIQLIEGVTGKKDCYEFAPEREGDHVVYISDISKARKQYDWTSQST